MQMEETESATENIPPRFYYRGKGEMAVQETTGLGSNAGRMANPARSKIK